MRSLLGRSQVWSLVTLVAAGIWAANTPPALAAENAKPLAVVSFSGYDEWMGDLEYVGKISDNPNLAVGREAMLKLFTQNKGLDGLD